VNVTYTATLASTRCKRRPTVASEPQTWNQLQSDCCHGWMLISDDDDVPRTKWFAPECANLLNWFANTRKCVAFCDANHLIFITECVSGVKYGVKHLTL